MGIVYSYMEDPEYRIRTHYKFLSQSVANAELTFVFCFAIIFFFGQNGRFADHFFL